LAEVSFHSLSRNSFFAAVGEIWRIGSRFILTPIIIAKLGLAGYGTWTLLFSVCGYADVLNTSFGLAYNKFTAELDRKKNYDRLSQIISSGIVLIGGLGLIGFALVLLFREPILRGLSVPDDLLKDSTLALPLVALALMLRVSFGCFFQVLAGLQRLDLQSKLNVLASVVDFLVTITLLFLGYGLLALALGHLIGQSLALGLGRWMCRRLCPAIRFSFSHVRFSELGSLLSLGGRFQLLALMAMALSDGLKVILSALCGVVVLAEFELAEKLLSLAKSISSALIAPLLPAFANLHAGNDAAKKASLYEGGNKLVAILAAAALTATVVFADPLLVAWTGRPCPQAAWTIRVLALGYFLWVMTGVGTASLRGKGTVRLEMTNAVMRTVLAAGSIVPLYWAWDYVGIVVGVLISRVVSSFWFLSAFARYEGIGFGHFIRDVLLRTTVIGASGMGLGILILPLTAAWLPALSDRWRAAVQVLLWGSLFGASLLIALWYGVLSREERGYLAGKILSFRQRWGKPASVSSA
jgi:O-antigen/teichoic acid export membrane protein